MFAWLVTLVLREAPLKIGIAQMSLLIPATLLMLVGGGLADRIGGKRVAVLAQSLSVIPPILLATCLAFKVLSYEIMIAYAICMGVLQAFVTPARDGLLNSVARGRIQRTVTKATLVQFVVQMAGFAFASTAQFVGGAIIIYVQAAILAGGAIALSRVPSIRPERETAAQQSAVRSIWRDIKTGTMTVLRNSHMRMVAFQNVAMGICFMGSYMVTIPLLIRERYQGDSVDLGIVSFFNSLGLVLTITFLLSLRSGIRRQGRALLLAHGVGAIVLGIGGFNLSYWFFALLLFFWGACGGVAMSMSRTIMQEHAPNDQRGRVMGFFSFSFMGAGPIGTLIWGTTAEFFGPEFSLFCACSIMFVIIAVIAPKTQLWRMRTVYA